MALADSYDGFIFDYGGVLVQHQTEEDQRRLAEIARIPTDAFTKLYWANRGSYDKGALSATEYWLDLAREAGTIPPDTESIERLTATDTESWMRFDSVMWELLEELRTRGKRLAMLSNMPRDLGEALRTGTERLNAFDHVTLSYEVRSIKPEPAIFEHCLSGLNTAPERTLFLDDRLENVHGAELLGIASTQFLNRDDVLLRLR